MRAQRDRSRERSTTFIASWSLNTGLADDFHTLSLDLDGDGVAEVYEEFPNTFNLDYSELPRKFRRLFEKHCL